MVARAKRRHVQSGPLVRETLFLGARWDEWLSRPSLPGSTTTRPTTTASTRSGSTTSSRTPARCASARSTRGSPWWSARTAAASRAWCRGSASRSGSRTSARRRRSSTTRRAARAARRPSTSGGGASRRRSSRSGRSRRAVSDEYRLQCRCAAPSKTEPPWACGRRARAGARRSRRRSTASSASRSTPERFVAQQGAVTSLAARGRSTPPLRRARHGTHLARQMERR